MSEKVHLENKNFTCSMVSSLCSLLTSSSMCDCTLICSDGQLAAHKVILAASSSFFSSVFSLHHHNHPLIYLRGVRTEQMQAVLSFVYQGTVQLHQEDLSSFLALAEDLSIEGLTTYNGKTENAKHGKDFGMLQTDLQTNKMKEHHEKKETRDNMEHEREDTGDKIENERKETNKIEHEGEDKGEKIEHEIENKVDKMEHDGNDKRENKHILNCTEEYTQSDISPKNVGQIEEDECDIESDSNIDNEVFTDVFKNVSKVEEEKLAYKSVIDVENTRLDAKVGSDAMFNDQYHAIEARDTETKTAKSSLKEVNNYKKYKSKESCILPSPLIKPLSCPVCKMKNKDNISLKKHMKTIHEVQCENCKLYFRNCNSLSVHMKSRCRNINKTLN